MSEQGQTRKHLAIGIGTLVAGLSIFAWFDRPECSSNHAVDGSRHVALVVDRSGSMDYLIQEVVENVNLVLDKLPSNDRVSILFFEDPFGVVTYVENKPAAEVRRLSRSDYFPVGGTPLYDAIGTAIEDVIAPTIGSGNSGRFGLVIVLSDGEENSSSKYSLSLAREVVAKAISQGIEIRFYGMGPAASREAAALGIPISNTVQVDSSASGLGEAFDDVQRSLGQSKSSADC